LLENGWNGLKTHDIDIKNQESWLEDENFENLRKWEVFGPLLGHFGAALRLLWGCFGAALGPLWGCFGAALGPLWGCFWAASRLLRGHFGALQGCFGDTLGPRSFGALGLFTQHCFWVLPFR